MCITIQVKTTVLLVLPLNGSLDENNKDNENDQILKMSIKDSMKSYAATRRV